MAEPQAVGKPCCAKQIQEKGLKCVSRASGNDNCWGLLLAGHSKAKAKQSETVYSKAGQHLRAISSLLTLGGALAQAQLCTNWAVCVGMSAGLFPEKKKHLFLHHSKDTAVAACFQQCCETATTKLSSQLCSMMCPSGVVCHLKYRCGWQRQEGGDQACGTWVCPNSPQENRSTQLHSPRDRSQSSFSGKGLTAKLGALNRHLPSSPGRN